ncbi:peptide ABC transporter substrate-binding protein [Tepidimicrobium xylanilyticum]|uniref:Oligopeptide transport system substrate-binding protein n=1 Tax=Tepidimicrobium xylanilyticum TaxID=1123352 RepID=A0A1H2TUS5_9FIRM|nr:peptide ABC transporter substrate-binding protein [Tepidimicrobium xylanilyticum]GMG95862.1 peptide-binding protein [Tepidimicrobium xylanilyticum]SDW46954.1 oligopeptide transport system substrate-binding protein [Tepidimicrobium xylanilyticum]
MKRLIALALTMFMIISGCSKGGTQTSGGNVAEVQEYRTVYSGEITTLNYLVTSTTNEFALAANLVDTLIDYDKYGVPQPCLATEWEVSEDGLVWTFKLREDVKWVTHEGEEYAEVTAQDFVDAMKYILNPSNGSGTANIAYSVLKNAEEYYNGEITDFDQVGVKAVDKYTLQYTLKEPTPYFLSMLTYVCFFPANGQFLEEVGDKFGTDNVNFLYNGAYIMEIFEPQNRRVLIANDSYWDKENVHIKKLVQTYNKEAATLAPELFLRGEVDYATISSDILDEWMSDPEKEAMVRPNRTSFYSYFYCFNFDPRFPEEYEPDNWKVVVNNKNFRKSLFHALDRKAAMLTAEPYDPEKRLSNTITPKNFVDLNGVDYTQLKSLAKFANTDSFNEKLALEYKEKALQELEGKAKFPVKILMPYNTGVSDWANRAQVIEQQMENLLGTDYIDIIIDPKPPTGFLQEVRRSGNYAFLECNWGPDYADPETYTDPFSPDGTYNWPHLAEGYKEANGKNTYENMVNEAKAERLDIEKRYKLFAEAEAFFIEEAFVIPYAVGGGGYSASRLNPFESLYSPFGVSGERFKGQKVLAKPMNSQEFTEALEQWEKERAEALKKAANQ